jgi:hypothetical protein
MKEETININLFSILILIMGIILGYQIGWVTEDYAPKLSLFAMLVAIVYWDLLPSLTIKLKTKRKKK